MSSAMFPSATAGFKPVSDLAETRGISSSPSFNEVVNKLPVSSLGNLSGSASRISPDKSSSFKLPSLDLPSATNSRAGLESRSIPNPLGSLVSQPSASIERNTPATMAQASENYRTYESLSEAIGAAQDRLTYQGASGNFQLPYVSIVRATSTIGSPGNMQYESNYIISPVRDAYWGADGVYSSERQLAIDQMNSFELEFPGAGYNIITEGLLYYSPRSQESIYIDAPSRGL